MILLADSGRYEVLRTESTLKIVRKGVRREFDLVGLIDVTLLIVLGRPPQYKIKGIIYNYKFCTTDLQINHLEFDLQFNDLSRDISSTSHMFT